MAVVVPAPADLSETAKTLLALADDVRDVRTTANGTEFEVPDELADRYHALVRAQERDPSAATETATAPARPVKRRGRAPRVNLEG